MILFEEQLKAHGQRHIQTMMERIKATYPHTDHKEEGKPTVTLYAIPTHAIEKMIELAFMEGATTSQAIFQHEINSKLNPTKN